MKNLGSQPARPREPATAPRYPRSVSISAAALLLAVNAVCCGGSAPGEFSDASDENASAGSGQGGEAGHGPAIPLLDAAPDGVSDAGDTTDAADSLDESLLPDADSGPAQTDDDAAPE